MFLAVALPVLATLIGSLATVDLTYLIRAGDEIFATGGIPNVDTWTFTAAGLPWVDQQWGTEVIFAAVYRLGGWTGLVLLRAVLVGDHLRLRLRDLPAARACRRGSRRS